MAAAERTQVFISYSHADARWLKRIQVHLRPREREGRIVYWDDTRIQPGARWQQEIKRAIDATRVAVLLVSADFLASEFIARQELPALLAAAEDDGAAILPVIVAPCAFDTMAALAQYQTLRGNPPQRSLVSLTEAEQETVFDELARAIEGLLAAPPPALPWGISGAGQWYDVPPRNPFFTGRRTMLAGLAEGLSRCRRVALCGLGGIGKTDAAVEYAHRHRDDYQCVFWVEADSRDAIAAGFATLARALALPEADSRDPNAAPQALRRWLEENERWLLVLDRADDPALLRDFLPREARGHVLLTSRAAATGALAERMEVERLDEAESALFLLRRAKLLPGGAEIEAAPEEMRTAAAAICAELGGIPLALDQAGAFVEETGCTLEDYAAWLQTRCLRLMQERGAMAVAHPDPVTSTWGLSFEKLERESPAAADLLRLTAFFFADAIPEDLLAQSAALMGERLAPRLADPIEMNTLLREAVRYSLLRRDAASHTLSTHRLVQRVLQGALHADTQRQWAERAVLAVAAAFPVVRFATWERCQRLLAHAQRCAGHVRDFGLVSEAAATLLERLGTYLMQRAQHAAAETRLLQARELRHAAGGDALAGTLQLLGQLYLVQSRLAEAGEALHAALALREQASPGAETPDLAATLFLLAEYHRFRGEGELAEPLYRRALDMRLRALAERHPDVAESLNGLAALFFGRGDYAQAELHFARALEIRRDVCPPGHPSIGQSLNNMAAVMHRQGKLAEAEQNYRAALAIRERVYGPEHPYVAQTLANLALLGQEQGGAEAAEQDCRRALAIFERSFGADSPAVAGSLATLAQIRDAQGAAAEAEALLERAASIRWQALPAENPLVVDTLLDLADLLARHGERERAARCVERAAQRVAATAALAGTREAARLQSYLNHGDGMVES